MSNLKPSLSLRRKVDVIEFNLRAKEKIFGDRCRPNLARGTCSCLPISQKRHSRGVCFYLLARGSARSENSSGEQFGVASLASRAITPWIRDGSLIAAHNMLWVLWVLFMGPAPYVGCPQGPKKERKKEMGQPLSQHFVLASREIESVTRRVGRWGFSKVCPWNGRIQP